MPKFRVYRTAQQEWPELVEADSEEDAIDKVLYVEDRFVTMEGHLDAEEVEPARLTEIRRNLLENYQGDNFVGIDRLARQMYAEESVPQEK